MKKFLVLYRSTMSSKEQMAKSTPEQAKTGMDSWMSWGKKFASSLIDMGSPLGDTAVLKGTAGQGHISGYSVVQAESLDAAKKIFEGHPHFSAPGGSIEVLEQMSIA